MKKRGQISIEYLIIMGFVTFVIITILGISVIYSSSIRDKIKVTQINNFGNKIISSSGSVFYSGEPSKVTINVYLPENVQDISISGKTLTISYQLSSGLSKTSFTSEVSIEGAINNSPGIKNIEIIAEEDMVSINQI